MARARGQETFRDMALSLGVVLIGVLLLAVFLPRGGRAVKPVDTTGPVALFARHAPYRPLMATGLPNWWKPTSVRAVSPGESEAGSDVAELAVGYVVDRSRRTFARLDETNASDGLTRILGDRPVVSTVVIAGQRWDSRPDADGHNALSRPIGNATVIVSDGAAKGGASLADLTVLAGALNPVPVAAAAS